MPWYKVFCNSGPGHQSYYHWEDKNMTENEKNRVKVEEVINRLEGKGTAVFIKKMEWRHGNAKLYRLSPSLGEERRYEYVVVSAVVAYGSGPGTYIFGCNMNGEDVDYMELEGSFRGELNHEKALEGAGYRIYEKEKE